MQLDQCKTLTGLTLPELAIKLDEQLPADAYKAIPASKGKSGDELTDIDPNYMTEVLTTCFGPAGVGYGFEYDASDMHVEHTGETGMKAWVAYLTKGTFWYALVNGQPEPLRISIAHSGGSTNGRPEYAAKGAITSATAGAVSRLGFQKSVYLGRRSHATVGKKAAAKKLCPTHPDQAQTQRGDGKWGHKIDDQQSCIEGVVVAKATGKPVQPKLAK